MGGRKVGWKIELELVTDDEIDPCLSLKRFHSRLGVAACHGDEGMGRVFQRFSDQVSRCSFGIFRHGTGIEHEDIGWLAELDELKSLSSEPFPKDRGFGLIQSAAERMKRCTGCHHKVAL